MNTFNYVIDVLDPENDIITYSLNADTTNAAVSREENVVTINPMAVGIRDNYLTVDYRQVDVDMEVVS